MTDIFVTFVFLLIISNSVSFTPVTCFSKPVASRQRRHTTLLCSTTPPSEPKSTPQSEKDLREELASVNELVELAEEVTYSYDDGDREGGAEEVNKPVNGASIPPSSPPLSSPSFTSSTPTSPGSVPPQLLKERPYPLFLLEKAADVIDELAESLKNKFSSPHISSASSSTPSMPSPPRTQSGKKEKVVVLGTGWGAASYLKTLETTEKYDVTVVSPRNFFLFTPMLAGAAVGTVEYRSITEAVRKLNTNINFLEATATNIDPVSKTIDCDSVVCVGNSCTIDR